MYPKADFCGVGLQGSFDFAGQIAYSFVGQNCDNAICPF
jgi:hypothetical protein